MLNEETLKENEVVEETLVEETLVEEENIIVEDIKVLEEEKVIEAIIVEEVLVEEIQEMAKFSKSERENFALAINKIFNKNNLFQLNGKSITVMRYVSKEFSQFATTKIDNFMFPVVHYELVSKASSLVLSLKVFGLKKDEGIKVLEEKILPNVNVFTDFKETQGDTAVLISALLLEPSHDTTNEMKLALLEETLNNFLNTHHQVVTSLLVD